MIWIIMTKSDKETYILPHKAIQITEALGKNNLKVVSVNNGNEVYMLGIKKDDIVISETRNEGVNFAITEICRANTVESKETIRLTKDKEAVKPLLADANIPYPKSYRYDEAEEGHCYFIKPKFGEDSNMIDESSICHNAREVRIKYRKLVSAGCKPIIEDYIYGDDYTVAVAKCNDLLCFPIKVNLLHSSIMTHKAKWDEDEFCEVPDCGEFEELKRLTAKAFDAVGCKHYMRIDFRKGNDGKFYLIDLNLFPGLGPTDHFAKCLALNGDLSYKQILNTIIYTTGGNLYGLR